MTALIKKGIKLISIYTRNKQLNTLFKTNLNRYSANMIIYFQFIIKSNLKNEFIILYLLITWK